MDGQKLELWFQGDQSAKFLQARPIKNFWGCLAQKVYENGWEVKTTNQLFKRIKTKLKEIDLAYLQSIMKGVKSKLRNVADHGVFHYLKKLKVKTYK